MQTADLCVSVQHFDGFGGDKQVHLRHHLRVLVLALLHKQHTTFNHTFYIPHSATFNSLTEN